MQVVYSKPIFDNGFALSLLLILSSISVLLGSGISLVQVDYKRQLVGSHESMGFMLFNALVYIQQRLFI